jgi:hypothetical protein
VSVLSIVFLFSACDIEQLKRFASGGYCDESTIVYLQHPCVVLTALEVLGYQVVASSSTSIKQDYNEYMWTMRKEFSEPEPGFTKPSKNSELAISFITIYTYIVAYYPCFYVTGSFMCSFFFLFGGG